MPWVRIHDGAISHPKIVGLIDWRNPFCVWVWGLSYCQLHLTDGAIVKDALPNRDAAKTAIKLATKGLWHDEGTIYVVHDYLDWNNSREVIAEKRASARGRVTRYRQRTDPSGHARDERRTSSLGVSVGSSTDSTIQNTEGVQGEPDRREQSDRLVAPIRAGDFGRIYLHRWQLDNLIATLGEHAADFGLDEWLDALNQSIAGKALPPDPWKFVKGQLDAEIKLRGLAVVETPSDAPTNKRIAGLMAGGQAFLNRNRRTS